jgi:signal transduction histidine kinase
MSNIFQKRFQLQLLFALVAAISVAALTVELVVNAIRHAEGFVLTDTKRTLIHAIQELDREYSLRQHRDTARVDMAPSDMARFDTPWADLPETARDLTLRAISQTVLASYPGAEGGFWAASQFAGYSYPTHDGGSPKIDVPAAERPAIEDVIHEAQLHGKAERVLRGKHDLIVISAAFESGEPVASWAMKRLPGQAEPAQRTESILLTALVAAALLGAAGVLATGVGVNRGVAQITAGLAALQRNFEPALPVRRDELGRISAAINEMARTRRRLEAEVRREDRARTVGRMIGRIAHEMRNPLNSIRLSLQMLAQRQEQNRLHSDDFRMVIDEVDRMNRLLSDLLAFQQPRPPRIEPGAVSPVLEECTQLVTPQALKLGVGLVVAGDQGQTALFDREYFRQIMVNLILNAVEVSRDGERVNIRSTVSNGAVWIEVTDHGPGLTPEQQEHIFEPFYTTKSTGHGLGLAVSRELAQSMGGTLSFRAEAAMGATFVLQLRSVPGK